jgi:2-dehydro-3-deoxyglucarate aldolase
MNPVFNKVSIGTWITLGHPAIPEIFASSGFDWLAIDLEHSAITLGEAEELIRIIDLKNVIPLVRLSSNNAEQIKRVMDAGAHGVIVPMVNNACQAAQAVAAVKYPPIGTRSFGLARAQGYGTSFEKYQQWQKENSIVVVQIEHVEAVENLAEILKVPGVDAYFVGPYDLSGSLGVPGQFDHPDFLQAMQKIKQIGAKSGKPGGRHIIEPDPSLLEAAIREGDQFIAYSLDTRMLDKCSREISTLVGGKNLS